MGRFERIERGYGNERTGVARRRAVAAVLPLILSLLHAGDATAQTSAPGGGGLEEITVTARRFEERLQTTGASVSAFTATRLEDLKVETVQDLQKYTPNLQLQARSATPTQGLVMKIRGLGVSDVDYLAADPSVAVYIDGIFQARTFGPQFELFDLERIEVLRGPQGTLYGKNALGGAINIVTAKPSGAEHGAVDLTLGDYGRVDVTGRITTSIVQERLFASVSATSRTRDGFYKNGFPGGSDLSNENVQAARLALRWLMNDRITVDLTGDYTRQKQRAPGYFLTVMNAGFGSQSLAALGLRASDFVLGTDPSNDRIKRISQDFGAGFGSFLPPGRGGRGRNQDEAEYKGVSLVISGEVTPDLTIRSLSSYRLFDRFLVQDLDGTPAPIVDQEKTDGGNQVTQELQANAQFWGGRVNLVFGGFALHEDMHEDQANSYILNLAEANPAFRALSPRLLNNYQNTALAAFANGVVTVADGLRVTAGLRYSTEEKKIGRRAGQLQTENVFQTMIAGKEANFYSLTPKFGIEYEVTDDIFVYASVSKGYASGGFNARVNAAAGGIESFSPEKLWSYEAGFKTTWLDRRLRFNAAVFRMDYSDIVIQTFGLSPSGGAVGSFTKNAGSARVQGAEFELAWKPAREIELTGGLGVLDQKFLDFGIGTNGVAIDPATAHFFDSPDITANVTAKVTLPLDPSWGELVAGADWSYRSRTYFDNSNTVVSSQGAYSLFGARLSYTLPNQRLKLVVFGENLADKIYAVRTANLLSTPFAYGLSVYGAPRTFGARLSYNF